MATNPVQIDKKAVGERISHLLKEFNIKNPRQFAISIGMDPSYFNKVINGETTISEKYVSAICDIYGVNREWLLYEIGNFKAEKEVIKKLLTIQKKGTDLENMANDILNLQAKVEVLLDEVAFLKSAPPKYPKEYWTEDLDRKSKELFGKLADKK